MTDPKNVLRGHKGSLTTYATAMSAFTPELVTRADYFTFYNNIENVKNKVETVYVSMLEQCNSDAEQDAVAQKVDPVLVAITNQQLILAKWDNELRKKEAVDQAAEEIKKIEAQARIMAASAPPPPVNSHSAPKPKLPQLTLPTFTGKFEEWLPFRDRYNQTVHNRGDLSGAEKFQYLLAALEGAAADLLESIPIIDTNYPIAYDRLVNAFEHTREIIFKQVDRILDHPDITQRSASNLRSLSNITSNSLSAIQSLGQPTKEWDAIIIRILTRKLDSITKLRFNQTLSNKDVPSLKSLLNFLDKEVLDLTSSEEVIQVNNSSNPSKKISDVSSFNRTRSSPLSCDICRGSHANYLCQKLNSTPEQERKKLVEKSKLCTNCLRPGHYWKQCTSQGLCRVCKQKHHSNLHAAFIKPDKSASTSTSTVNLTKCESQPQGIIKPTAIVHIFNANGEGIPCRVLIDNCADDNFISNALVKKLNLSKEKLNNPQPVSALEGKLITTANEVVQLELTSTHQPLIQIKLSALIVKKVGGLYPKKRMDPTQWSHLPNQGLADPNYYLSNTVDMLLSTTIHYQIIRPGLKRAEDNDPVAQESQLGWLIGGGSNQSSPLTSLCNLTDSSTLENQLQMFWKLEECSDEVSKLTPDEIQCETLYNATTTVLPDGSYQVKLPFKVNRESLGNSKAMAVKRFYSLESKFQRHPNLRKDYSKAICELLSEGHMEEVPKGGSENEEYFLPHHPVFKASTTTKMRIVFDASARSTSGQSLNDQLLIGPTLQEDLTSILIRWRYWIVPFKADVKQMYHCISLHPSHRKFQRIVWRESQQQSLKTYQLKKVTFGVASSPYLAVKTMQTLAQSQQHVYPIAAEVVKRDFYVDDCLSGAQNIEDAKILQQQLIALLSEGNFILRKWSSSQAALLENLPEDMVEQINPHSFDDSNTKALGLIWNPSTDSFKFSIQSSKPSSQTKRNILAEISRVYDPLGFLSPFTVRAKLLMQQLWKAQTAWDNAPPKPLLNIWKTYQDEMKHIEELSIPRCLNLANSKTVQIHGFSDASEKAYAAAVYIRIITSYNVLVRLVAAKTRVAPTKEQSIPKLELCGAVLLSSLITIVRKSLPNSVDSITGWTDSTITLAWVNSDAQKWKTFIRNRVISIQMANPAITWKHVPGALNPADLPSRGISVQDLVSSDMWFSGPSFLQQSNLNPEPMTCQGREHHGDYYTPSIGKSKSSPRVSMVCSLQKPEEDAFTSSMDSPHIPNLNSYLRRESTVVNLSDDNSSIDIIVQRYSLSSWNQLRRHTAWWKRFWSHLLKKTCQHGPLTPLELQEAEESWIRYIQRASYPVEVARLEEVTSLPKKSSLLSLNPFLKEGLLRVGGRVNNASISYNAKHPILLPRHHITDMILQWYHHFLFHAGPRLMMNMVQSRYWLVRCRQQVRKIIHRCKICVIHRAATAHQMMADLPQPRVKLTRPFTNVGVDFAGPVILRDSYSRSPKTHKAYIAVYVCMCTKAVHLELVSNMTSEAFLASLRRLVSTRGLPTTIRSDNGSNFIGANRELQEILKEFQSQSFQQQVSQALSPEGITWIFNPPAAPHMGGLWEAAVKSTKFHLHRVLKNSPMNFEEYATVLKEIEACLNSRPLCPNSTDPDDLEALTPGHFIIGEPLKGIPELDLTAVKVNRLNRWQQQQQLKQHFWRRWHIEYLQHLQKRTKWKVTQPNVKSGDLVVLREDNAPPQQWKLGRVEEVHPNEKDDKKLIRTVTVRTADGKFKRPITRLVLLPSPSDDNSE